MIEKGITQAYEVQRRLKVWEPKRAAVLGAGTIGLLAAMGLRNRGLDVVVFGLDEAPYLNSELVEAIGAVYVSTKHTTLEEAAQRSGRADLVFECTGFSPLVFDAPQILGKNGVMILSSVTGGDRSTEVPSDAFNLDMVLGNKVLVGTVNANRQHFEEGVRDMAVSEARWPGWLGRLITHRIAGLDNYEQAFDSLARRAPSRSSWRSPHPRRDLRNADRSVAAISPTTTASAREAGRSATGVRLRAAAGGG